VLVFSFIRGLKEGAVKEFSGLAAFIIALPLVGVFIGYIIPWFSFVGDASWRGFLSFLTTMALISIVLYLLFWIPRGLIEKIWNGGFLWSLLGGLLGAMSSALGLVLLVALLDTYPLLGTYESALNVSQVLNWLVGTFGAFVLSLMHMTGHAFQVANIFSCVA
jgi:hypothetical protein